MAHLSKSSAIKHTYYTIEGLIRSLGFPKYDFGPRIIKIALVIRFGKRLKIQRYPYDMGH